LDKEERKINDRIENLKNANSSLLNELKALQQNYVNIKFENLCLKEKLDKFSNGNSNENEIENMNENNIYLDKKSEIINDKSTNPRSYSNIKDFNIKVIYILFNKKTYFSFC